MGLTAPPWICLGDLKSGFFLCLTDGRTYELFQTRLGDDREEIWARLVDPQRNHLVLFPAGEWVQSVAAPPCVGAWRGFCSRRSCRALDARCFHLETSRYYCNSCAGTIGDQVITPSDDRHPHFAGSCSTG